MKLSKFLKKFAAGIDHLLTGSTSNTAYGLLIFILILIPFIMFIKIFLDDKIFGGDSPYQDFPLRFYFGRYLSQGYFPLWARELNFGHPFFAETHTGLLYPPNVIFSLAAFHYGHGIWQLDIIFHLSLSLVLFYFYALETGLSKTAAFFTSICTVTGGYFAIHTAHNSYLHVISWTGAILLFENRFFTSKSITSLFFFSLSLLMAFLSGFPPAFFILLIMTILYAIVKMISHEFYRKDILIKIFPRAFLVFSAVFLIPALFYLSVIFPLTELSIRREWPEEMYFGFHIKIRSFLHMVYMNWFRHHPDPGSWEFYAYTGPISVFLAVSGVFLSISKKSSEGIFWLLAALTGMTFAGADNFIYKFFFHNIPGFNYFRVPGRYIFFLLLAVGWFAGYAIDRIRFNGSADKLKSALFFAAASFALLAIPFYKNSEHLPLSQKSLASEFFDFSIILFGLAVVVLMFYFSKKEWVYRSLSAAALILLVSVNATRHKFLSPAIAFPEPLKTANGRIVDSRRIPYDIIDAQGDNFSLLGNEFEGRGYLTLEMSRQAKFKLLTQEKQNLSRAVLASAAYRTDTEIFPAAYFASDYIIENNSEKIPGLLSADENSCPLYLEAIPPQNTGNHDSCMALSVLYSPDPNVMKIQIPENKSGFIYISQTYYPGWKAYVDGKRREIYIANYNFMAVPVQKNEKLLILKQGLYLKLPFSSGITL